MNETSAALACVCTTRRAGIGVAGGDELADEQLRIVGERLEGRLRRLDRRVETTALVSVIVCQTGVLLAQRDGLAGLVAEACADVGVAGRSSPPSALRRAWPAACISDNRVAADSELVEMNARLHGAIRRRLQRLQHVVDRRDQPRGGLVGPLELEQRASSPRRD